MKGIHMTKIETDSNGDMRAYVGQRCVAVAWRSNGAGYLRLTHYNVHDIWQGGSGVSAIGRSAAKTTMRRMAHAFRQSTGGAA
jgi:hypothetical protein